MSFHPGVQVLFGGRRVLRSTLLFHVDVALGADCLILGAPGLFHWKGGVILLDNEHFNEDRNDLISKRDTDFQRIRQVFIPNTISNKRIPFGNYFGYVVNSGIFLSALPEKRWFVASAPRGAMYRGKVFIFDLTFFNGYKEIRITQEFDGQQVGEYFGASLCIVDVNGDGVDDVIVGAPRHTIKSDAEIYGDEGAVYVFLKDNLDSSDSWGFQQPSMLTFAQEAESQFGTCISSLGDIDQNGYNDIAVGAPYEDNGHGAIYIYLGSQTGLRTKYSQHILARTTNENLLGFGMSISRGVDIDQNHYNDIAVGAYRSGHVVLFRSQPVARLSGEITPSVTAIGLSTKEFNISICLLYNGSYIPKKARLAYEVVLDPMYKRATFLLGDKPSGIARNLVSVDVGMKHCTEMPVQIRELISQDFSKPIEVTMNYTIADKDDSSLQKSFCASCPIVDPTLVKSVSTQVGYSTGCGSDQKCSPNLHLSVDPISSIIMGVNKRIPLNIKVKNTNEPAFQTLLLLDMPKSLTLGEVPSYCNEPEIGPINCELGNIISQTDTKVVYLELETMNIDGTATEIEFTLSVTSVGDERDESDNIVKMKIPVLRRAQFTISGKSVPEQLAYKNSTNEIVSKVMSIDHIYEIHNLGPSPITRSIVQFHIPVMLNNITLIAVMEPETSLSKQSFTCNASYPGFTMDNDEELEQDFDEVKSREKRNKLEESSLPALFNTPKMHNVKRRDINENYDSSFPTNRTLFLNCSHKNPDVEIHCLVITCSIGLLEDATTKSVVKFSLQAQIEQIEKILGAKDITQIDVDASVIPVIKVDNDNGGKASITLGTTLMGSLPAGKIPTLWIALAIALGLMILTLITSGLVKSGFFNRNKRDELQLLKGEIGMSDFDSEAH